ncbi:MAG: TonB-dependent receptor [Woeseiaceae bacterium]|nr:TonB-dependent receptor [Woeseiaceae bacterium]
MRNHLSVFAIVLAYVLTPVDSVAADQAPGETIIVTATRTEIPLSDAIVPVTVITREDIELSLATDLADILRFQAGIDIGRNGGPGQATSVFMRGTESNHTLVLMDGVRMNPGTLGGAAVQHIAPEIIERIEIVKGARSALFGTDAIGGVINIVTRRADAAFLETAVGAGSFDSQSGFISAGNRGDNGDFGVTLNWQDTAGFAPRTDSDIERGYDNLSANLYGAHRFSDNEISLRHWQTQGNVEYLDFFLTPADQDFENSTTAVELDTRIGSRGTSKFIASYMQDDIVQNQSDDFVKSDRISLDWQYSHAFARHTLTGGLFAVDENASTLSFGSGFDEDTEVRAAFIQDQWSHERHKTFVALRLTDHEAFGNQTTWNAEYAYELTDNWTINAGLGHAFRAPDATDRFGFGGNPDLDPELADEAQIGLRYAPGSRHSINIEFYRNDIEDLIEFDLQTFELRNIAQAEIRGAQIGYEYRGERFVVHAEVVKQSADDAVTGDRLLRRAEETASLSYTQDIGAHRVGLAFIASGDREDFGGVKLDGYLLADLTAQFNLGRAWTLHARIENLLDTHYQTADNFRMQERGGFVQLKYRWN